MRGWCVDRFGIIVRGLCVNSFGIIVRGVLAWGFQGTKS